MGDLRLIYFSIISAALITSSCAEMVRDVMGKGSVRRPNKNIYDEIRWFNLEDPDCMQTGTSLATESVTVYLWDGSKIQNKVVPLKGIVSNEGHFASSRINGAMLGAEMAQLCTVAANEDISCKDVSTGKESGSGFLKICRQDGTYQRESIEAMALTAQYIFEESFSFYNQVPGKADGLENAYVVAQLRSKKDYKLVDGSIRTLYESDNAAYQGGGEEDSAPLFHLYPSSSSEYAKSPVNLWEVPFVMRHEFAHHVFDLYTNGGMALHGLKTQGLRHATRSHSILPSDDRRPLGLNLSDSTIRQMALDGVNEVFADLYAYFESGGNSEPLKGVTCLSDSRDPGSPTTKGGAQKGLTAQHISIYEGRSEAPKVTSCYEPTYDGVHDIALTLGYPLAQFIKTSVADEDSKNHTRALLIWATRINSLVTTNLSSVTLDTLIRELVLAVKEGMGKNITTACPVLKSQITGLPLASAACQ